MITLFATLLFAVCFNAESPQNTTSERREEMIVFRDAMDSHNEDGNWFIHDTENMNIPIQSPLDSSNICWNIAPSNNNGQQQQQFDAYFYRITDLSPLKLSSSTIATLRYDIIAHNLPPSLQCNVYYSIFDGYVSINDQWQLISSYNASQNGQSFATETFDISLSNHGQIGIKFSLSPISTNGQKQQTFLQSANNENEPNGCYVNTVSLSLSTTTMYSDENNEMANSKKFLFSDNLEEWSLNAMIFIATAMMIVCICCIALIVLLCKCCCNEKKKVAMEEKEAQMRVIYNSGNEEEETGTSLQIGRVDPSIQQFSPTLWTHDTMNPVNNHLHPSPIGSKRIFKPSISQFSQQSIHKSANLYEYDVENCRANDEKLIINVIGDMQKKANDKFSDDEIDIAYDENTDEYVTRRGDEL